jgi:signal transduction histidine kinase
VTLADPDAGAETWRSAGEELLQLSDQQERLIAALLTLATGDSGIEQYEPFDLAALARNVVLARRHDAERRGLHVDQAFSPALAMGDPRLMESLVANLVDNALRYNIAGGRIEISTTTADGSPHLSVRNTGVAVPPGSVDRLFQPFRRLGRDRLSHRDGHGLGLAIVRAIANAHGATLVARARSQGGLDIEVILPPVSTVRDPTGPGAR